MSSSSAKPRQRGDFKPKLIALSVAACFSLSTGQSLANPTGGTVSSGSASFASSGNTLTITNSANAIINWQSFSNGRVFLLNSSGIASGSSARTDVAGFVASRPTLSGQDFANGRLPFTETSG